MARRVMFEFGDRTFAAVLRQTPVAEAIWEALPLEAAFNTWGDEIYFATPVELEPAGTQATVAAGDVAYWPPGRAICLFWGPTPTSGPGEIRPASPVAVFARLEGNPTYLAKVGGRRVRAARG